MDDLDFCPCCELTYGGASDNPRSITSKPIILAVDDDEDNLLLLAYALEPFGCNLLTASDGLTALRKAQAYQPNLILLDILMPYMNGMEVVIQLKKDVKMRTVPVIAVTALARIEDRERLLVAGFNDYISKPYMIEEIEALVRHYLPLPVSIS
ncbi:response regulator [Allocoleopsis franciscana]|uniref:Response regulator containing a CheY-like receiver domain and an HD-GYP domain n=1 Tax=Allocoleopsis franciscana PCC 7113 TaxID=1173027 RepID=K9WIJ3_9CYAN|nr:response regulator [Allocoleopsis franciscana]AFZ19357.1 response regulator containing a CheY-like receiver domain and an HD-GYP domain [Allocoleopsis franciscana PCC 7113]